jgi:hypothetical protein
MQVQSSSYSLRVRPKPSLSRNAIVVFLVTSIPVFGVLYWYAAAAPVWQRLVDAVYLTVAVACLITMWRQSRVFTGVTSTELVGNGIFSPTESVRLDTIDRVVLVPIFRSHPTETTVQLVALSVDGDCLFRMRGGYWHTTDLTALATAIGRPVVGEQTAISEEDFFAAYPGSAYWFERSIEVRLAVAAAIVIGIAIVVGILALCVGLFHPFP